MKHKYLDKIGFVPFWEETESNSKQRHKHMKQKARNGFDDRETYDLDYTIAAFVYERLCRFNEINCIDTTGELECRYPFNDETLNLQQVIDKIISGLRIYLTSDGINDKDEQNKINEAWMLLGIYHSALWW